MTDERRQLLLSLQVREETLRDKYETHIQQLEERNRRKIDILIKQHQSVIGINKMILALTLEQCILYYVLEQL